MGLGVITVLCTPGPTEMICFTSIENCRSATCPSPPVTRNRKLYVPGVDGAPVTVLPAMFIPGGSEPETSDQVYGNELPLAIRSKTRLSEAPPPPPPRPRPRRGGGGGAYDCDAL